MAAKKNGILRLHTGFANRNSAALSRKIHAFCFLLTMAFLSTLISRGLGKSSSDKFDLGVSICIPVMRQDVIQKNSSIFIKLLKSIREQTVAPKEVILGLSEVKESEAKSFQRQFQTYLELPDGHARVELVISAIEGRGSVGQNRNRAAALARSNIISFFDADGDLMHHQRVELLLQTFISFPSSEIVVHGFTDSNEEKAQDITNVHVVLPEFLCAANAIRKRDKFVMGQILPFKWRLREDERFGRPWLRPDIHHGHLSLRKSTFMRHKFDEDFGGQEDSIYVSSSVEHSMCAFAHACVFIDAPLTRNYVGRSARITRVRPETRPGVGMATPPVPVSVPKLSFK